jgi:hypothetical protein
MSTIVRILAILLLPARIADLITLANRIVAAMTGNAFFPTPPRALSAVTADILALSVAEVTATLRTKGAAQARNVKRSVVISDLRSLQAYVQQIADGDSAQAAAIIQSAGMSTRRGGARPKAPFTAKQGAVSGLVLLIARALASRASYQWAWSVDQKNWTVLPSTLKAHTSVAGLTAGTTCYFRFKGVTKAGETDWSQIVALIVK